VVVVLHDDGEDVVERRNRPCRFRGDRRRQGEREKTDQGHREDLPLSPEHTCTHREGRLLCSSGRTGSLRAVPEPDGTGRDGIVTSWKNITNARPRRVFPAGVTAGCD